ncbi:helix-turn-helix domain-containing protein [Christiangramia aquimixticola]|uniref:helix-turn-helix domain-containing protein n=1 Tax=Christiangramia aquimixticola TaxID=1697558 RepID=UPI003AA91630
MVNTDKFASRLGKILKYYDLSAASFADKIEVGRSSISHILSGRNKPSLDFVMKVVKNFPEVELYWLLNGKGEFPASSTSPLIENKNLPQGKPVSSQNVPDEKIQHNNPPQTVSGIPDFKKGKGKDIQRIVIFYTDGSFEAFEN